MNINLLRLKLKEMRNQNYSILKKLTSICSLIFKKILPDIPNHSFCFHYYVYPDEFQISISSPDFTL